MNRLPTIPNHRLALHALIVCALFPLLTVAIGCSGDEGSSADATNNPPANDSNDAASATTQENDSDQVSSDVDQFETVVIHIPEMNKRLKIM